MQTRFGFSISRIYDYFQGKPFAIISAYLSDDDRNEARADALKKEVRNLGYGYREIKGRWAEKEGPQAGQVLTEYPLFIPGISREDALYLGSGDYFDSKDQYSIIYSDGEHLYEIRPSGAVEQEFHDFEANDLHTLWEYFSEYNGKPFRFGQVDMVTPPPQNPKGWAEHRAHYASSEADEHFYDHRRPSRLRQAIIDPSETLEVRAGGERDVRCYSVLSMPDRKFVGTKLLTIPHRKPFRLSPKTAKTVKWAPHKFKSTYRIPESNARNWELHPKNLLLSRTEISEEPLERISWHPLTGEMILSAVGESYHAHDIHNHGSKPFDEYIRALVLPKKKRVVVRPWMPFTQMEMMRLEGDEADIVSFEGQDALRRVLESAGMPKSWSFEYDGDNRRLEKLTGRRGW